jgi:hypothetical protein
MRLTKFIVAATAAWALWALPSGLALAHGHHGSDGHHAQEAAAKQGSKSSKPAASKAAGNEAKKPVSDCCTPAAKPEAKKPASAAKAQDCCTPTSKSASKCADKGACKGDCKDKAACKGNCKPVAKAACGGECADKRACCKECCRKEKGWGKYLGGRKGAKIASIRYMPALAGATNQHIVFSTERSMALTPNFSVGGQFNHALQIGQAAPNGPWYTPYGGFLPKVGANIGPVRADLGALLGGGAMFRTTAAGGVNNVLEARLLWAVEPRVDLGMKLEQGTVGLTAGYLFSAQQAEFGGPTVGLRWSWKQGR